jgi:multiple sugar transport system permease protein
VAATALHRSALEARDARTGLALIAPAVLLFVALIAYPLLAALGLSFFKIYTPTLSGPFIGLDNYAALLGSSEFWSALRVSFIYAGSTLVLQMVIGVAVALMLHQGMFMRSLARALVLFPYLLSTVVAVLVWQWLFNDLYGMLNHLLMRTGLVAAPVDWLGSMPNALLSVILVSTWKFFPFVVIAVLARLQSIPLPLYEAAMIDGAGPWARFWDITLPQLRGVLMIVVLLRAIWDFKEFDLIYLLTGGGPVTSTQTLPILVYRQAFPLSQMGMAATIALCMLAIMVVAMIAYMRRYGRTDEAS